MGHKAGRHGAVLIEGAPGSEGVMLLRLAAPMAVGLLAIVGFNVVDTLFVSMLGVVPLAAMSFTFPVVMIVGNLALGIGVGTTSCVARALGAGDRERVRRLTTDGLLLGLVSVAVMAAVGLVTIRPVFTALGADGATLELVSSYMRVWYLGSVFVVVPMIGNSAIRATGDTFVPAVIMTVAGLVNALLDPLLIFGLGPVPALGIEGAALATVAARAATMAVALWVLDRREGMIDWGLPRPRVLLASWREILHVGAPATITGLLVPVSMGAVTALTAAFGTAAVAALGAATRVEGVTLIPLFALGTVTVAFVGQNAGAGRGDRVARGLDAAGKACLAWGVALTLALQVGAGTVASVFSNVEAVAAATAHYLRVASLGVGFLGISFVVTSALNGAGRPLRATVLMVLRTFGLTVPLAALGARLGGFTGLVAGVASSFVLSGFLSVAMGWSLLRGGRNVENAEPAVA